MKNILLGSNDIITPGDYVGNTKDNSNESLNFSPKAYNTMITDQIAMPPARVWDRIEKILDEQETRRKIANDIITTSISPFKVGNKRKNLYFVAAATGSLLAGLIWKFS